MIELNTLLGFYPPQIADNAAFRKHILKEYVELLSLEYLSRSPFLPHLTFIGGTNLRLVQGIDRFSEDLDFDCKDMDADIYRRYTGGEAAQMKENLSLLLDAVGPERVTVRVPLIPGFNTPADQARSVDALKAMGVTCLDCFSYVMKEA